MVSIVETFSEDCLPMGEMDEKNFKRFIMLAEKAAQEANEDWEELKRKTRGRIYFFSERKS